MRFGHVFIERFEELADAGFDEERDAAARAAIVAAGYAHGADPLTGAATTFRYLPEREPYWRENLVAEATGSFARQRSVACMVAFATVGSPDVPLPSLRRVLGTAGPVLLAEGYSVLARAAVAACAPGVVRLSEYFPAGLARDAGDGVLSIDLQAIAFPDASFSLIVSNGVMEHIPDAPAAEAEIARVLMPGGTHGFTIPFDESAEHDTVLAELRPDGAVRHHGEPIYHEDPLRPEGALVYRRFSHAGLRERYARHGCTLETYRLWSERYGLLGPRHWIHLARKGGV